MTIEEKVREILSSSLLPADPDNLRRRADLRDDLGADSLDIIEIQMQLETELGVEITDATAECWRTVQDVIDTAEAADKARRTK